MNDDVLDPTWVGEVLTREWGSVTRRLASLRPEGWELPTRLSGWSVRDLARHLVWGVSMEADALRRARTAVREAADGRTLPESTSPEALLDELHAAVDDLTDEVARVSPADAKRSCPMPYGDVPTDLALDVFVFEAALHSNDVAHAAGDSIPLPADTVGTIAAVLRGFMPAFGAASTADPADASFSLVGDSVRLDGRWEFGTLVMTEPAAAASVTISGDDSSLLLFATGRLHLDDDRLRVQGAVDLARDFKVLIPGP
jgi:uncharacterized protein (TIGR03083 family)